MVLLEANRKHFRRLGMALRVKNSPPFAIQHGSMKMTLSLAVAFGAVLSSVTVLAAPETVPLAGEWRLAMGAPKPGVTQQALPALAFADTILCDAVVRAAIIFTDAWNG